MYASPALVRPHFASVFDRPVAVWIARLGTRKAALAARFNDSIYSDELRRLIGIAPIDDTDPVAQVRAIEHRNDCIL